MTAARRTFESRPSGPLVRMLDANFNRALEGCRVVEDAIRLGRPASAESSPAPARYQNLKHIRHRLSFLRSRFGLRRLVGARSVANDPGAFRRDPLEKKYRTYHSMIAANLQRVKEALRVIEEVGRMLPDGRLAGDAKRLRFQAYELEEHILLGRKTR